MKPMPFFRQGTRAALLALVIAGLSIAVGVLTSSLATPAGGQLSAAIFDRSILTIVLTDVALTGVVMFLILLWHKVDADWQICVSLAALLLLFPLRHRLGGYFELTLFLVTWITLWWITSLRSPGFRASRSS